MKKPKHRPGRSFAPGVEALGGRVAPSIFFPPTNPPPADNPPPEPAPPLPPLPPPIKTTDSPLTTTP